MTPSYIVGSEMGPQFRDESPLLERVKSLGPKVLRLTIDPLRAGWNSPLKTHHFRSGCAPLEALVVARQALAEGSVPAVLIEGIDFLKSDYARDERQRLMEILDDGKSLPEAYTDLCRIFLRAHGFSVDDFFELRDALVKNYQRTLAVPLHPRAFAPLTDLYRLIDCANPSIDFCGRLLLAKTPHEVPIAVAGVAVRGPHSQSLEEIARYQALTQALHAVEEESGTRFLESVSHSLLEVYTCYPVVPLAFLLVSKLASDRASLLKCLETLPLTVSGGMNLARAPWNNPVLRALVLLHQKLSRPGSPREAWVHGNGGLGERQAVALLRRRESV